MSNTDCIFCQIVAKEIPAKIRYEDDNWLAFDDHAPYAPVHILLIPKKHYATLEDVDLNDSQFHQEIMTKARQIAKDSGIDQNYKLFMNVGLKVQAVHHIHLHILGGWEADKPNGEIKKRINELVNA